MRKAYRIGRMSNIVPAVQVYGWRHLVALKEQLPGIFVSGSKEPLQGLVLIGVEFP